MKVLSIQQPWTWLLAHGIKDVENREWPTSYRGPVLLHAGKRLDVNTFYESGRFGTVPFDVKDVSFLDTMPLRPDYEIGGVVGIATLTDVVTHSESPWFRGTYGLVLKDAQPVEFFALRGLPGLFDVPDALLPAEIQAMLNTQTEVQP